ncbi:MAG: hypothetical protein JOZ80_15095 [Acidobacteriaceae bacterium]|nr:hypothetical protein [Acidobacteriaceae bacterium]
MSLSASDQTPADAKPGASAPHLSKENRIEIIRAFDSELVYIRAPFPMGKRGLTLRDGTLAPTGQELQSMIAMYGPAVKPGDQARISRIDIRGDRIHFEINGGPVKKQKWYQRIEVGGMGGTAPIAPSDSNANPRGSYVDLVFDHYVPDLTGPELKKLLRPVFDFDAKSPVDAYLETVPPQVKEAIKNHHVLVGMNREMVTYAKGRPPKKIREKDGDTEYEDWVYGEPPQDVDFVRLVGDEVVRVETMKVDGEKIVRTEKEIDLGTKPAVAQNTANQPRPANAPSLRRPGEELPNDSPKSLPSGGVAPPPSPPPSAPTGPPGGNSPNL